MNMDYRYWRWLNYFDRVDYIAFAIIALAAAVLIWIA